uniref:M14 family zinc carboxypeptidase n=1 Tax=Kineococcus sp. SYSU DK005 TaxID=3383126 RepID=UPI003D7E66C3
MRKTLTVLAAALVTGALAAPAPAVAAPAAPPAPAGAGAFGREGAERPREAAGAGVLRAAGEAPQLLRGAPGRTGRVQGYPRRTELAQFPVDAGDRSLKLGLTPYHDLAPWLNDLQRRSDRVSVEVIGRSTQGRDLYLVTVTSPESAGEARRQERMRARIQDDPAGAARDRALLEGYKAPVFVNANIHGNEWEGTDGARRVIERLATSDDPGVRRVVDTARVHVVVTMNPDGRVAGTRRNAADFDLNRDFITASQPETRAVRDAIIGTQPRGGGGGGGGGRPGPRARAPPPPPPPPPAAEEH